MRHLITYVKPFITSDEGQDLLEYALLVALIAIVAIGAVTAAGLKVNEIFNGVVAGI
jgi:Flp pilus assembly pilin Flp